MVRPFAAVGFTLFFTLAILSEFNTGVTATAFAVFAVALVICLFVRNVRRHGFLPAVFASGAIACVLLLCETYFIYLPALAYDGRTNCRIRAEITDVAEVKYGNYYYEANLVSVDGEEASAGLRLVFSTPPEAEPYDLIEGDFNIYALGASDEDFMKSYRSKGIFIGAYPVNGVYDVIDVDESSKPFAKKIIDIREAVKRSLFRVYNGENGGLAAALIIGDKSNLSRNLDLCFKDIGISHIICVSGYHLSLWALLILKILRKTKMNDKLANVIAGLGVIFFMLLTGLTYSVVRAGIMMLVYLFGNIIMKQRDSLNSLGIALSVLAVAEPFSMGSLSLQLSALATTGIILYGIHISPDIRKITNKIGNQKVRSAVNKAVNAFMITAFATAFTLPVSLFMNNSFNFLCFAANMIIVPVAGASIVVCSVGALFGFLMPQLFNLPAFCGNVLLDVMKSTARFIEKIDVLTFRVSEEKIILILGGVFVVLFAAVIVSFYCKPVYSVAVAVCALVFTVGTVSFSCLEAKETKITVFDCGNGASVLISTEGENLLVGAGGTEFLGSTEINNAVDKAGGRLDAVFLSHSDETSGEYLIDVIKEHRPRKISFDSLPDGAELLLDSSEKSDFLSASGTANIFVKTYKFNNNYCAYIETDDISLVVCLDPVSGFSALPPEFSQADAVVSRNNLPVSDDTFSGRLYVLSAEKGRADKVMNMLEGSGNVVSTAGEGNIVIRAENGKMSVERD